MTALIRLNKFNDANILYVKKSDTPVLYIWTQKENRKFFLIRNRKQNVETHFVLKKKKKN